MNHARLLMCSGLSLLTLSIASACGGLGAPQPGAEAPAGETPPAARGDPVRCRVEPGPGGSRGHARRLCSQLVMAVAQAASLRNVSSEVTRI